MLVAARALQGVFGALLTPSALAVIIAAFPPAERGAAIGSWTAWTGIAFVVGPLAGGVLVDHASWRWIFAINVPFVAATLRAGRRRRRASGRARPAHAPVDWLGAALCALGLAGPVFALIRQPELGWGAPAGARCRCSPASRCFAAFLWREARTPHPMLPLELFRAAQLRGRQRRDARRCTAGCRSRSSCSTLFLQQVAGYSALAGRPGDAARSRS